MLPPPRTWLYVPGHNEHRIGKALASGADAIVIDLEDAVPVEAKSLARAGARTAVLEHCERPDRPRIWVRVNAPASPWHDDDLAALRGTGVDGLRIPKVEDCETIRTIADATGLPLQPTVESARGLLAAAELASAHPLVAGIGLGEADLAADLRVGRSGLDWARGWIVAAARAAGLPSPIQSVYTDVRDLTGLREDSVRGRELGFHGRSVIHPDQIDCVNDVFTPSDEQVRSARAIVDAARIAAEKGSAALLDDNGRFIDPAVVDQARVVLSLVHP